MHECPRKYQLYKLKAARSEEDISSSVTFSYGHCVGLGLQLVLQGKTESEILLSLFQEWKCDLAADNPKQNKSFYQAVYAVQKFVAMREQGYLANYELVSYRGKPAVELSFRITILGGYTYRGYVDAVLRHKISGEVVVLEVKTSSAYALNPASYKNSAQAIGYSVVLDVMFPELSSYKVIYLVYKTKELEYEQLDFSKTYLQRALWIQELMLDVDTLTLYETSGIYPMRGESCAGKWGRDCEYLQVCTLSTDRLSSPVPPDDELDAVEYQIELSLADLITSQLTKN
jgi:hypothetical protein